MEELTTELTDETTKAVEDYTVEEEFAIEDNTEINIIESTSIKESIVRVTRPPVTLRIQNQSQVNTFFK